MTYVLGNAARTTRLQADAGDVRWWIRLGAACWGWYMLVRRRMARTHLHAQSLILATHVLTQFSPPYSRTREDILRGIAGEPEGTPMPTNWWVADYVDTNAIGWQITPRLVLQDGRVFELDIHGHDQTVWKNSFERFWRALNEGEKNRAWRNFWIMTFHNRVCERQIVHEEDRGQCCRCLCCRGRRDYYLTLPDLTLPPRPGGWRHEIWGLRHWNHIELLRTEEAITRPTCCPIQ